MMDKSDTDIRELTPVELEDVRRTQVYCGRDTVLRAPTAPFLRCRTDGSDQAYLGSWGVGRSPTAIPDLFAENTGGISANETVIFTGFHAGAGGDELDFTAAACNGDSAVLTSPPSRRLAVH